MDAKALATIQFNIISATVIEESLSEHIEIGEAVATIFSSVLRVSLSESLSITEEVTARFTLIRASATEIIGIIDSAVGSLFGPLSSHLSESLGIEEDIDAFLYSDSETLEYTTDSGEAVEIEVQSTSEIQSVELIQETARSKIRLLVSGETGTVGQTSIRVSRGIAISDIVMVVNGEIVEHQIIEGSMYTIIRFSYSHSEVDIRIVLEEKKTSSPSIGLIIFIVVVGLTIAETLLKYREKLSSLIKQRDR